MSQKILTALSGGVDSAVAMCMLKQQGYDVSAAYMKTWMNEEGADAFGDCPWHQDITDASACAECAGVPFEVVDFIEEYRSQIVDYLVEGYRLGRTPNPDVMCNRRIKFGKFLDYAISKDFDTVATGHYCRLRENPDGTRDLITGLDPSKDQSYFLAMITQRQLMHAAFPIGSLLKSQVREIARLNKLPNSEKKDSQGICFLGKIKISDFLSHYIPQSAGDIVNAQGKIVGRHNGLHNYTLGQRRGLRVPSNTNGKRYVVIAKDYASNTLKVDFEEAHNPLIWTTSAEVGQINWINRPVERQTKLFARVRYRDPLVPVNFVPASDGNARIEFKSPQRAIAPGQVLALHAQDKTTVLGGAFFLG